MAQRNVLGGLPARAAVSLQLRAKDTVDIMRGRRADLVPPRRLQHRVGDSSFVHTGEELARLLRELGVFTSTARVLDIGCGVGRVARVLAGMLQPPGSYDGFDVMPEAIGWCQRHYRDQHVPFRFIHADIENALYNPDGAFSAADFRFPYADGAFDLVLATSVFTHLLAEAAERYLDEAARVLAPGGYLFTTWFLRGPSPAPRQSARFQFARTVGAAAIADPSVPEAAVAYDADWVEAILMRRGVRFREPPLPGSWAGTPGTTFQDIVIAHRS